MINVSVLYPKSEEATFDLGYYCASHVPLVKERFGALCKRIEVNVGLNDPASGAAPSYLAIAHMYFDSVQDFQTAFGPHAQEIMGDIQNYTNIQPTIQFSEVK
jgi:uncharacterized protein (TIGR02118 family)